MTTRTVIHDGSRDDEIEELARFHGAVLVHRSEEGSWTLIDGHGAVHTLPLGASLVCTHTRRHRFFSVHVPLPEPRCRIRIRKVDGLWHGWIVAPQLPSGAGHLGGASSQAHAIWVANRLLTAAKQFGWRPPGWDESRSPQRMQVLPPERAEVPA